MASGRDPDSFWRQTPRIIRIATTAHQTAIDTQNKQFLSLAYHIEALARQKTLPDYSLLMGIKPKAQSEDELWAAVDQWMAIHNSRYALAVQLGEA